MKPRTHSTLFSAVLAVACLALVAVPASALTLRNPQVPFSDAPLQNYMNVVDPGINVLTQQVDAQVWSVSITGNTDFTLMLKNHLGMNASVGVYNGNDPNPIPALFQVFPGGAVAGWYATLHFGGGNLIVSLFDQNSTFMGQTFYPGVDQNNFGFYIQGPGGTWFSQDARNAGAPEMLAYNSVALPGDFWLCWAAESYSGLSTFDDVVINVQSIRPTPAVPHTWGSLKARYR
jgi:hypothetical protein